MEHLDNFDTKEEFMDRISKYIGFQWKVYPEYDNFHCFIYVIYNANPSKVHEFGPIPYILADNLINELLEEHRERVNEILGPLGIKIDFKSVEL